MQRNCIRAKMKMHTGAVLYDVFRFIKGLSVKGYG